MQCNRLLLVAALALSTETLPALAQPRPEAAELPVTRIVLFSSGVGYFQRDGQVDGTARIDLQFHTHNINDLLKSLILQDADGGRVHTVSYDSRDPIEKTLKSFALDLTSNPTLGDLLGQVRGERVEVVSYGEQGKEGQPTTLTGVIVGVQKQKKQVGKEQVIETEQLNLLTSEGLQGVTLGQVQRIKLLKPELEQEFRKALEVLATAHDKQKKTVSLNFLGNGKRLVRVGYVTESPIWKTSYRLSLDKKGKDAKVFLQGWAIVENTTDEDWNHVQMGLVSGRPISFQMNLYDPLYVPRPTVDPELFASLRPQTYGGALWERMRDEDKKRLASATRRPALHDDFSEKQVLTRSRLEAKLADQPAAAGRGLQLGIQVNNPTNGRGEFDLRQGVASAAIATELGKYFQYQIEEPVSLARQKSALLPIVNGPVEAARVSIYNEAVHAKFPLHGLRLKNTTGLHLMQGPVTVFEGGSYAGDARIADLQPNETRLVSYAVDLGTEVLAETKDSTENLVAVKVVKGILHATHKLRQRKHYTVKNRSEHDRLVLLEHPYRSDWSLVDPKQAAEKSRDVYRFELKVAPGQSVQQDVVEENTLRHEVALTNSNNDTVRIFLKASVLSPKVKEALEHALQLKGALAQTQRDIAVEEQALKVIEQDQSRMRANMERVPQTSEAYKRYLKKFDDQETEIEKRRATIVELQGTAEQQRESYETFLANLTVE